VINQDEAQRWIERWDAQQQQYLPDREDRFTAIIDAVEEIAGRTDPWCSTSAAGPARWRSGCCGASRARRSLRRH
jgi:hypothetical protein